MEVNIVTIISNNIKRRQSRNMCMIKSALIILIKISFCYHQLKTLVEKLLKNSSSFYVYKYTMIQRLLVGRRISLKTSSVFEVLSYLHSRKIFH